MLSAPCCGLPDHSHALAMVQVWGAASQAVAVASGVPLALLQALLLPHSAFCFLFISCAAHARALRGFLNPTLYS